MAQIWKEDIPHIITIFAEDSAVVTVFYKKRGSSVAKASVSEEPVYRGDGVWEVNTSFKAGDYILFITVNNNTEFGRLLVLTEKEYYSDLRPKFMETD